MDQLKGNDQNHQTPAARRHSLRKRVLFSVALPTFLFLITISSIHYWWEHNQFVRQFDQTIEQLNNLALNNIKYALVLNDPGEITNTINAIAKIDLVQNVQIVDENGNILVGSPSSDRTYRAAFEVSDPECSPCHIQENNTGLSELTGFITVPIQRNVYRAAAVLDNTAECQNCHENANLHLGVLLIDLAMPGMVNELPAHLQANLLFSLVSTLVVTLGVYVLVDRTIVRRIEKLREPIVELSQGNYETCLKESARQQDEIDDVMQLLNQLAEDLQQAELEQTRASKAREQAILFERERIAREIHDNVSQLLGYVSTKSQVVRLLLGKEQYEQATSQLKQLEEAAQTLYLDVRQMISELNVAEVSSKSMSSLLETCANKFQKYSEVGVIMDVSEEVENISLLSGISLEIERIVREALTNVQKHASAKVVRIGATIMNNHLYLTIQDDGSGFSFNPDDIADDQIGLRSIQKRAMDIGAEISIHSKPSQGTSLKLVLPLPLLTKV